MQKTEPGFHPATDGVLQIVDIAGYLGQAQAFQDWLSCQTTPPATSADVG